MEKKDFLLRTEYEQWLIKQGNIKSGGSQNCYVMLDLYPETDHLYYDVIVSFLFYGERAYAYTVLEEWFKQIGKASNAGNKNSYLNKYKEFLFSKIKDIKTIVNPANVLSNKALIPIRKKYNKSKLAKLDAMDALVNAIGEDELIRLVVETSFFFDCEAAKKRFKEISDVIVNGTPDQSLPNNGVALPARKSEKTTNSTANATGIHKKGKNGVLYFVDNSGTNICPIKKDGNGNAMVCQLINKLFGYNMNVNQKDKPFRNYIVSHIWGNAIDPRYFTNLWNIVLVPAWANHLLDKPNPIPGLLESKLKDTIMKVCIKYNDLHNEKKYDWNAIRMQQPVACNNRSNNQKTYSIQVIKEKGSAVIGKIEIEKIKI